MVGQSGLFDVEDRLRRLSDLGDQLEAFASAVDFEVFRPELERELAYSDGAKGGRPPFDPVMMPQSGLWSESSVRDRYDLGWTLRHLRYCLRD